MTEQKTVQVYNYRTSHPIAERFDPIDQFDLYGMEARTERVRSYVWFDDLSACIVTGLFLQSLIQGGCQDVHLCFYEHQIQENHLMFEGQLWGLATLSRNLGLRTPWFELQSVSSLRVNYPEDQQERLTAALQEYLEFHGVSWSELLVLLGLEQPEPELSLAERLDRMFRAEPEYS